jgi:hypothetical protein
MDRRFQAARRVFVIDDKPVEAGECQRLRDDRAAHEQPAPKRRLATPNLRLQGIFPVQNPFLPCKHTAIQLLLVSGQPLQPAHICAG